MEYHEGTSVRLSDEGIERARQMPEAWGLHRAATFDERGEVLEVICDEPGAPIRLSVEFPSGSVHNWPASCFVPASGGDGAL